MKHVLFLATVVCILTVYGFTSIDLNNESAVLTTIDSEEEIYNSFTVNESSIYTVSEILAKMENGEDMSEYLTISDVDTKAVSNPCRGPRLFCVNNATICKPRFNTLFVYQNLCDPSVILSSCNNHKPKCRFSN